MLLAKHSFKEQGTRKGIEGPEGGYELAGDWESPLLPSATPWAHPRWLEDSNLEGLFQVENETYKVPFYWMVPLVPPQ